MTNQSAPTLLLYCTSLLAILGVSIFAWGKKTPGKGSWLTWAGILILLTVIGVDSGLFLKQDLQTKIWTSGWVWSRLDIGAITVGVYQDALSLCMSALTAVVVGAFLLNSKLFTQETNSERTYAALILSMAGVTLAWNSLTPWLFFVGLMLTILGGTISLGSRWDSNGEASIASRFIWERSSGFLISFFGACILATTRPALLLNEPSVLTIQGDSFSSTWIGVILLVIGLFIQMQPFPLLGWLVSKSEISHPVRILMNQIFPAWAAFPLLLRLAPQLVSLGLFPAFGWFAVASAILIILSGLFQSHWRAGLSAWLAAGFSLSCALLAFSGPLVGTGMLLGVSLAALGLASGGASLEGETAQSVTHKKRAFWVKTSVFLAMAGGTGVVGFVSATSGVRWINQAMDAPAFLAAFLFVFFLFVLLGWKQAWQVVHLQKASDASWLSIFAMFIWVILSLGLVWTGSVSGDVVLGSPDRVMGSFFSEFFGVKATEFADSSDFITSSGLYWGALVFGFFLAYWTAGRKENKWTALSHAMPKLSRFLAHGYGIDGVVRHFESGIVWLGKLAERVVDQKIWTEWIPQGLFVGVKSTSKAVSELDTKLSSYLDEALKKSVEVPAKLLQLIQTGDVRWYLFFALGSGFALLLTHFLKNVRNL